MLEDVNDEIPLFTEREQETVLEGEPVGSKVTQVNAIDKDGTFPNNQVNRCRGLLTASAMYPGMYDSDQLIAITSSNHLCHDARGIRDADSLRLLRNPMAFQYDESNHGEEQERSSLFSCKPSRRCFLTGCIRASHHRNTRERFRGARASA